MLYEWYDIFEQLPDGIFYSLAFGPDLESGVQRHLKWSADACEVLYLAFSRFRVESFHISPFTFFDRSIDIDLHEVLFADDR